MVYIGIWEVIAIGGVASLFCFLGAFFAKRKPEWDNNARDIKKIVYEEGIHLSINTSKKYIKECSSSGLSFGIDKDITLNCILRRKTKDSLTELEEQLKIYNKAQSLAAGETRIKVREEIAERLSGFKEKVDSGSIKILGSDSLEKVFTTQRYIHGVEALLQYTLEGKIGYTFYVENHYTDILEIQKHSDESTLRRFFEELNTNLQSMDSLFFFKRERELTLNKIDTAIEALEKDEKKLSSFMKFWYGWKKEEEVINLNHNIEKVKEFMDSF